ncbi:MAG: SusC/RagA family TonB-linked outer membrane protein [Bacteroidota bacterium]|nr:SusC/RagA family TonB-linked outer membrane protein [Bacteroidota bacterium]
MKSISIKFLYSLIALVMFFSTILNAQVNEKITIRGKVIDKSDKSTIISGSVVERDKDMRYINGVVTDANGNFAIKVTSTKNLISFSYLGYKTVMLPINDQRSFNIELEPNTNELKEVVVTANKTTSNGTGLNIDARSSTIATSTLKAEEVQDLGASSIDQALSGRLSGVDVGTTTGDPGAGMQIRIRGTASINGSANPLIVLDGMPYETQIPSDFNFGTADETGYAQLLNIAPSDINDITVLKDAASTALWGSRAANGVLIINTKRGTIGRPSITYNLKTSFSKQPNAIPMLNGDQYSTLIPEEVMNKNGLPLNITANKEFSYDTNDPLNYYNYSRNTDWIRAITQIGYSQDHNISMTGGGEKARYYASLGYLNQTGTTVGTNLNRITSKINLDYNVSNRIRFKTDITYTHVDNQLNYASSIRNVAYNKMPNMSVYQYDEYGNLTSNFFSPAQNIQGSYSSTYNPVAMALAGQSHQVGERITPKFNLQYSLVPSVLLATVDVQFDINNTKTQTFLPQIATGRPVNETVVNRASFGDGDQFGIQTKTNFIYTPKINDRSTFQALLSIQSSDVKNVSHNALTANTASDILQDPSSASRTQNSDLSLTSSSSETRSIGALFSAQYGYLDRYLINVGLRADGNSRFGPNNRYGLFPSVSTRYRLSGEPFMKQFKFLDELSLRASYGHSGNVPGSDYSFYNLYQPYNYTFSGMSGVYPSNMELSNLKWQTVIGKNLGFNLGILKNRIIVDAELYQNTTRDMFYNNLQISTYNGFSSVSMNVGTMDNNGFELMINTIPIKTTKWSIGFDFNISKNINTLRSVSDLYPKTNGVKITTNGVYQTYLQIGNPFGSYYGFKYEGVYTDADATIARDAKGNQIIGPNGQKVQMRFNYPYTDYLFQPGDAKYADINNDGNIDYKDIVYLGNGIPKFTGGFGPNITFMNNLKLSFFFNYRWGYQLINGTKMSTTNMYGFNNQSTAVLSRWRNPGDITDMPRALYNSGYNWLGSSRYVEDASFVRLRSVTLRYNFTPKFLQKIKFKTASFYLTAENLYTWTKYTGQDPDVSTRGDNNPLSYNVDNSMTPPGKNFLMGVTVGF